jgi:putative peptide zinc metalloprotease protein
MTFGLVSMTATARPVINPLIEVSPFDADSAAPAVLCTIPVRGRFRRVVLPRAILPLLRLCDGTKTPSEVVDAYLANHRADMSREHLRGLVEVLLPGKGILVTTETSESAPIARATAGSYLHIQFPFVPSAVISRVAVVTRGMFSVAVVGTWSLAAVLTQVYFFVAILPRIHVSFASLTPAVVLCIMLLSTVAAIVHEFGHASSAARYGCRNLRIGWGMYLVFTVLWTDVSDAWKLPRYERAVVDVSGIYFESVFLAVILASYLVTQDRVLALAFLFVDLGIAATLNPFFRQDGYWLLADLAGIANLREKQVNWLKHLLSALKVTRPAVVGSIGYMTRRMYVIVALYSVLGMAFFLYVSKILVQRVVVTAVWTYPATVLRLMNEIEHRSGLGASVGTAFSLLWESVLLLGTALLVGRAAVRLAWALRSAVKRTRVEHGS